MNAAEHIFEEHVEEDNVEEDAAEAPQAPWPVLLTDKAARMVQEAMQQDQVPDHLLRIGIKGGACAGMQYVLDFSPKAEEDDYTYTQHGVPICVDQYSALHFIDEQGHVTQIDYVEDSLHGEGFQFQNPNVSRSCGCGSSFQT